MENETITYTNKFSVITDTKKNEFIITFYQDIPKLDENFNVMKVETVKVGTFVMNRAMFNSLCSQFNLMQNDVNISEENSKKDV